MTETEFIDRLQQELTHNPAWNEIQSVVSRQSDPTLGANELLVIPHPIQTQPGAATTLRITVEPLI